MNNTKKISRTRLLLEAITAFIISKPFQYIWLAHEKVIIQDKIQGIKKIYCYWLTSISFDDFNGKKVVWINYLFENDGYMFVHSSRINDLSPMVLEQLYSIILTH